MNLGFVGKKIIIFETIISKQMKNYNSIILGLFFSLALILGSCGANKGTDETSSQEQPQAEETSRTTRPSPLRSLEGKIGNANVLLQYGAPSVRGRVVWGDLVPYNEVWRTGANESTFLDFDQDVTVEGQVLKAGRYSLFTIPRNTGKWTVIFNAEWDLEHGHFQYKQENDVLRVESTPEWLEESQEQLSIAIESPGVVVRWEKLKLPIVIQ